MIDSVMKHRRDNTPPPVVGAIVLVTCAAIDKAICLKRISSLSFLSLSFERRWTNEGSKRCELVTTLWMEFDSDDFFESDLKWDEY